MTYVFFTHVLGGLLKRKPCCFSRVRPLTWLVCIYDLACFTGEAEFHPPSRVAAATGERQTTLVPTADLHLLYDKRDFHRVELSALAAVRRGRDIRAT